MTPIKPKESQEFSQKGEDKVLSTFASLTDISPSGLRAMSREKIGEEDVYITNFSPRGFLLYSTCSLSSYENDDIIDRLLTKFPQAKAVFQGEKQPPPLIDDIKKFTRADMPSAEPSKYGFHILPDRQNGAGPLFFALIQKPELI